MKLASRLLAALAAALFIVATSIAPAAAQAVKPDAIRCPAPNDVDTPDLFGLWRAEFEGGELRGVTLLLERHPEYEGVRGFATRDGVQSMVAGDVDGGQLTLEESDDGHDISGTWVGRAAPASCGFEWHGTYTRDSDDKSWSFVMRKVSP